MATHSRHAVAAPPEAPARESTRRLVLRGHAIFVMFTAFVLPFWYYLLGGLGAALVIVAMTIGTLSWFVPLIIAQKKTNPFRWRRLPWAAVVFMAWSLASITWSQWPSTSAITVVGTMLVALHAFFLTHVLSWRELLRVFASALKWVVGLSFVFELFVSLVIRKPIFAPFVEVPSGPIDPQWYWSRDNLIDGGRIQGIVGNANLLAVLCLLAIIVFLLRFIATPQRRTWMAAWIVLAAFLMYRAASATVFLCAFAVAAVLACVLIMRRTKTPAQRSLAYFMFGAVGAAVIIGGVVFREHIFGFFGRSESLTGRAEIWAAITARIGEHPVVGWGYASPWPPFDERVSGGLVDHGQIVMQAHNMWIDVVFQLGWIGFALLTIALAALVWRSWFFAVDRPRWDLVADRPYSATSLLPILVCALLLVQSLTESTPMMLWGWMLILMLSFKIKSAPTVGIGTAEQQAALELGEAPRVRR